MVDQQAAATSAPVVRRSRWRMLLVFLAAVAVSILLVRGLVVQAFVVPTDSMSPTVRPGDRVLVWRPVHFTGTIERGDIVVFDGRGTFDPPLPPARTPLAELGRGVASMAGMPVGQSDYVKRVVGLPGEHVVCCDDRGRITVDDEPLDEPYLADGTVPSRTSFDVTVPPEHLWLLGDNRDSSADSRAHLGSPGGGAVPVQRVVGRVDAIWWPMSRVGGVDR